MIWVIFVLSLCLLEARKHLQTDHREHRRLLHRLQAVVRWAGAASSHVVIGRAAGLEASLRTDRWSGQIRKEGLSLLYLCPSQRHTTTSAVHNLSVSALLPRVPVFPSRATRVLLQSSSHGPQPVTLLPPCLLPLPVSFLPFLPLPFLPPGVPS